MTPMRIMVHPKWLKSEGRPGYGRLSRGIYVARTIMTRRGSSVRPVAGKYGPRRSQENLDIEPEGPGVRISEIETHHVVKGEPAPPVDLPEAGDSGLHFEQAPPVPDVVGLQLIGDRGSGPDQRHLPPQYVEELGELVPTDLAQEPPDASHPRILGDLVHARIDVSRNESCDVLPVNL